MLAGNRLKIGVSAGYEISSTYLIFKMHSWAMATVDHFKPKKSCENYLPQNFHDFSNHKQSLSSRVLWPDSPIWQIIKIGRKYQIIINLINLKSLKL